ncbi:MAG: ribonuclease Z [Rhodothermales bacterium]|nr:ribonuclease Z [Rhodothermales bacterium]
MFSIVPLGVASALPTLDRHFSSTALVREGHVFLFDCGEGTQLQLVRAGLKRPRIEAIFITHLHGDHVFGLPGLLSTLALLEHDRTLRIVGPVGLQAALTAFMQPTSGRGVPYSIEYIELPPDLSHAVVLETPEYRVEARPLSHSLFTAGFRFQEKARPGTLDADLSRALGVVPGVDFKRLKSGESVVTADGRIVAPADVVGPARPGASFAYVTDTQPCDGGMALAEQADLMYHEATFRQSDVDRARETRHATALEAAGVAREAGARQLLLGHFSARYDGADLRALLEEARTVFQNTEAAEELKRYSVAPPDANIPATIPWSSVVPERPE